MSKHLIFMGSWQYLILLPACLLAGCSTTPSASALRVKIADDREVSNCKFITNVQGSSGLGNLAASTGIQNAKNEALEQAAADGATHVVWTSTEGFMGSSATGEAYRCD
jgi:hypothetical protein